MKNSRNMALVFVLSLVSIVVQADSTFEYQNEFKAFETNPRYAFIFNKDGNDSLKSIQADVEIYKDLNILQRLIRFAFFGLEIMVVKSETMPKLYSFVDTICKNQAIETPTIFIAKNTGFFNAVASKLLTSSGAIVIGQKLIEETCDEELQGVLAHELGHIVYNHVNKTLLVLISSYYGLKWAKQYFLGTSDNSFDFNAYMIASNLVTPLIINKQFEREADEFAYKVTNNAQGFIQFFELLKKKEQTRDQDFETTKEIIKDNYPQIGLTDYWWLMMRYYAAKTSHTIDKGISWIYHNTPIGAHPSHEDRIQAAQEHLALASH